ncbi:MAG: type IV pilin-like G/H family protein [Leptolyngbyaceae cyanobacterium]
MRKNTENCMLKLKLMRHVLHRRNSGFTLIELLVVVAILGALAAVALPSIFNQAAKAKQAEAKNYVGAINRAQQAYNLERSQFASSLTQLGVGVRSTPNYTYSIQVDSSGRYAFHHAASNSSGLRSYVGMTAIVYPFGQAAETTTLLCESEKPTTGQATVPTYDPASPSCTPGTRPST